MLPRKVRGAPEWLAPAREPVAQDPEVQDPEVETPRPGAAAAEPVEAAELAETRVLLANSALRDQAAAAHLPAGRTRPEAVSLVSLANLRGFPEVALEPVSEPVSELVLAEGRAVQRAAAEADLGRELGRAVARVKMKSTEFWVR